MEIENIYDKLDRIVEIKYNNITKYKYAYNGNGDLCRIEDALNDITYHYEYDNYLQSRYYDPAIKRFINADDVSYLGVNGDFVSLNLYAYCSNNPMMYIDPFGTTTVSYALGVNATALFGFSFSIGFSYDYKGNIAIHYSYAFPKSDDTMYIGGLDAGISVASQITCLDTVDQLEGKSGYIGASGGYLGYFGADAVFLPDNYEGLGINESSWIGVQVTAGFGIGADAHIMESNTVMSESFNVFNFFIDGIKKVGKFFKEAFQ